MDWVFLAGRILFVLLFVLSGVGHWTRRAMMVPYTKQAGVPFAELMVPLTGVMLVAGGIGVGFGIWGDLAALLLVAFLVPTAFLMHRFWGVDAQTAMMQQPHFMKNISLAGAALVMFFVFGELDEDAPLTVTDALFF